MSPERALAIVRDAGCILLALGGIALQQYTGHVQPELLAVYTALLGVPGVFNLRSLYTTARRTPGSSSPSRRRPSSSGSSSPSARSSAGEQR